MLGFKNILQIDKDIGANSEKTGAPSIDPCT